MTAPDYNVEAGCSPCCAYCDARHNCHSTVLSCIELSEYAGMRELSAQIAAVIARFSAPTIRQGLSESIADALTDWFSWFDADEFVKACQVKTEVTS